MAVCVVGAGIIGLPTAVTIQQLEPRTKVTLVAEYITPNTLSDLVGGFWRPIFLPDPREELIRKWGDETFQLCEELWKESPQKNGCIQISGFEVIKNRIEEPYWKDTVYGFRKLKYEDLKAYGWEKEFVDGYFYTSYCLQPAKYLPTLLEKFRENGGRIVQKRVQDLSEAISSANERVIVNCSGLGAYDLVPDRNCFPIRGQVLSVKSTVSRHFYIIGDDHYVLPNEERIVLGGTHQAGNWNRKIDAEDRKNIMNGITHYLPWMKEAEIIGEGVGLRPGRPQIRLEAENRIIGSKPVTVC